MNSKSIFKRMLPIAIALLVILIATLVGAAIASDKKVPGFSDKKYGQDEFITYTTASGEKISLSRNAVYEALRGTTSTSSVITDTTVNEIVNMIDKQLLATYVQNAKAEDVYDVIAKQMFSATFDEYVKKNETSIAVSAHKEGKSFSAYLTELFDEAVKNYVDTLKYSYGIKSAETEYSWTSSLNADGEKEYKLTVSNTSEVYAYFALEVARTDYAKEVIKEEYEKDFTSYIKYLAELAEYKKYTDAVEQYKEDLEDWKNTGKKGTKPVASNYYTKKVSKPEEVKEPLSGALNEDAFKKLYEEENYKKFWSLIVTFETESKAQEALLQYGVVISENASGVDRWFHYGVTNYASATAEQKALIDAHNYTTKASTNVIIDKDYYNLLTTDQDLYNEDQAKTSTTKRGLVLATSTSPDPSTGAYELSEAEIKSILVKLYNQQYQNNTEKQITATDYDPVAGTFDNAVDSKLFYSQEDLTELGLYSSGSSSNKFVSFKDTSKFEDAETYSNTIVSGDKYYLYIILGKDASAVEWEDYLNDAKYYELPIYTAKKEELLEGQVSATYAKNKVSELRNNAKLVIFDETLETNYMNNYKSDYKATKKSSKTVVASFELNGNTVEITVDQLWAKLGEFYGVYTTVDLLQYEWVFMEATDSQGELLNKYVDYQKYLSGKKLKKCIKDNDDAKKLYESVCTYVENVKYYFSVGSYESSGYPASYGWKNFINDYYATYYNVKLESNDDLRLFFINQQIISDYSADLCKVTEAKWNEAYLTNAGKTLGNYINASGVHLLIALPDAEKNAESGSNNNFVDPTNWTAQQLSKAEEVYDYVLNMISNIDESEISSVLTGIANAFEEAPLPLADGTTPNISYTTSSMDESSTTTHNYFTYNYEYYKEGETTPSYVINVSELKAMGFMLTCENLDVTAGAMVPEFEEAVRQIWNKSLDKLVKDATVEETVIYDHSFIAPKYKNYDENTDTETVVNDNAGDTYLTTTYGLHVYVNQSCDLSAYFTTDANNDKVFIAIPEVEYAQMYVYDLNLNADPKFVSLSKLYKDLTEAKEENDEYRLGVAKENIKYASEKLGIDENKFNELLENYAGDNASYVATQLKTYFTSYDSENSEYSLCFADYKGSSYYHLQYMNALLAGVSSKITINSDDAEAKEKFTSYINYFIKSYNNSFKTINFLSGSKEACEDLLDALAGLDGNVAYQTVASDAMNALKASASQAYNKLTSEEKSELLTKAAKAGIVS